MLDFGGSMKSSDIIEFVDQGRNVLLVAGDKSGNTIRDVAAQCGFEVDEQSTAVIDFVNNNGSPTTVKATNVRIQLYAAHITRCAVKLDAVLSLKFSGFETFILV